MTSSSDAGGPNARQESGILVVAFAGLPGTGKTALARRLAARLNAPLLDKDAVREALFGPAHVDYSDAQNDFCCEVVYRTVDYLEGTGVPLVLLDGRTYARATQVTALERAMERPGRRLAMIECTAAPGVVRSRLEEDARRGSHPATNRGPELYEALRRTREPLERPRLELDTGGFTLDELERRCLDYLELAGSSGSASRRKGVDE